MNHVKPPSRLQITVSSTALPLWMQGPVRRVFDASVVLPL
jgi:hypothetical protein